jgi:hypothetical protein
MLHCVTVTTMKGAVATAIALAMGASAGNPENTVIRPGVPVFDTQGNRLYAGGANIWFENNTFWLVGEVIERARSMHCMDVENACSIIAPVA